MPRCPFGYTAAREEGEEEEIDELEDAEADDEAGDDDDEHEDDAERVFPDEDDAAFPEEADCSGEDDSDIPEAHLCSHAEHNRQRRQEQEAQAVKAAKKAAKRAPPKDDEFDMDPVTWFRESGIKTDEDFAKHQALLRKEAAHRLEKIEDAKRRLREIDSDMDSWSGSDLALSDFDDDKHSLCSLMSCANEWISDAEFKGRAEFWIKCSCPGALLLSAFCLYQAHVLMSLVTKSYGVLQHTHWPMLAFIFAGITGVFIFLVYCAVLAKSKKLLLAGQVNLMFCFALTAMLVMFMHIMPTAIDPAVEDAACNRDGRKDISNRLCKMIPHVELELAQMGTPLFWSCTAVAGSALLAVALGVWYAWELGFVEKKAIKHKRRFRRTKHTIPWDLIKISEDGDQYETAKPAKNVYSGGKGTPDVPRKARKVAAAGASGRSRKDKRV